MKQSFAYRIRLWDLQMNIDDLPYGVCGVYCGQCPSGNGTIRSLAGKLIRYTADLISDNPDFEIKECDGCHSCWKGNDCSKQDDMNELYPQIAASDVLIFGTPVYW